MNGFIRLFIVSIAIVTLTSCASQPTENDDFDSLSSSADSSDVSSLDEGSSLENKNSKTQSDELGDFDDSSNKPAKSSATKEKELSLEEEFDQADGKKTTDKGEPNKDLGPEVKNESPKESDDFAKFDDIPEQVPSSPANKDSKTSDLGDIASEAEPTKITELKFRSNENGGTIIVQGNRPLTYKTHSDLESHQYIVELENATLPEQLKNKLQLPEVARSIGAIETLQNPGSTTVRFVVQMKEGVSDPVVQTDGNSLLIVASGAATASMAEASTASTPSVSPSVSQSVTGEKKSEGSQDSKALAEQSLGEFLAGNNQFYGSKISMEYDDIPLQKALSEIIEQSGLNAIISEEVKGSISLKLRKVPWDQALVVIMQARKLGYVRQGNLLRIAPLADLKADEEEANKIVAARRTLEPLKVRMFPVSYAKVDELSVKIKDFLGERGKAVGDTRTNVLVVTDIQENLDRVAKLITSLDTQPQQVLIEGKIVEAQEDFTRSLGVSWGTSGNQIKVGTGSSGPVNMTPRLSVNQGSASTSGNFAFGLDIGTLDIFGSLTAALALSEQENKVKVLASPRIFTLSNESASIDQTTEVPVKTVTVNGNATQTSFSFKPLTLKLDVTPQVTSDGSVIMKMSLNRQFQGAVVDATAGSFSVNSREAKTKVLVKNGQTAVVGGIYQSDATDGEQGVPGLREAPLLGWLFKSKTTNKTKSELLIFLTPRILGQLDGTTPKE